MAGTEELILLTLELFLEPCKVSLTFLLAFRFYIIEHLFESVPQAHASVFNHFDNDLGVAVHFVLDSLNALFNVLSDFFNAKFNSPCSGQCSLHIFPHPGNM